MRFLREQDVSFGPQHRLFREAAWLRFITVGTGMILVGIFATWAIRAHEWGPGVFAIGTALISLLFIKNLMHCFHPANWLMAVHPYGLWLKIRAYDNDNMDAGDLVVVHLAWSEIAWARKVKEVIITPDRVEGGSTSSHYTWLELQLHDQDLSALEEHLRHERISRPAKGWKSLHYPVRVVAPGRIRVEFSSTYSLITPRIAAALELLKGQVEIRPEEKDLQDYTISSKDKAEQESRILELIQRGDRMAAIQTVRKLYGYSLIQARQFIAELEGRPASKSEP